MDIRELQYFLSVAKHLSFTKAARECYVAQAAISQQIDKLERELGFKLFTRSNRGVALTPAGESLAEDARRILDDLDKAVDRAGRLAKHRQDLLRIGLLGHYEYQVLHQPLRDYRQRYPQSGVELVYTSCLDMEQHLRDGAVDLAFGSLWEFSRSKELLVRKLLTDEICAIMSREHPLARAERLSAGQLAGQDIVMIDRNSSPALYARMVEDNIGYGYTPNIVKTANTFDTMLLMVDAGLGIALFPSRIRDYLSDSTAMVPLEESSMCHELAVAKVRTNSNPAAEQFLSLLAEQFPELRL